MAIKNYRKEVELALYPSRFSISAFPVHADSQRSDKVRFLGAVRVCCNRHRNRFIIPAADNFSQREMWKQNFLWRRHYRFLHAQASHADSASLPDAE